MKSILPLLSALAALLPAVAAAADRLPEGKYRCYLPPAYTVHAWFEVVGDEVAVNGGDLEGFDFDTAAQRVDWPADALPPYRHGFLFPPGAAAGDAERTTVVLAKARNTRPGQAGWNKLPRCYQTTH